MTEMNAENKALQELNAFRDSVNASITQADEARSFEGMTKFNRLWAELKIDERVAQLEKMEVAYAALPSVREKREADRAQKSSMTDLDLLLAFDDE